MSDQHDQQRPITTTEAGIPVSSDEYSLAVGPDGPTLLQDSYLIEKMAQFNRERVPERVVHAKGSGAFGYFEVTTDVTQWTRAAFLNTVGQRTPSQDFAGAPDQATRNQTVSIDGLAVPINIKTGS